MIGESLIKQNESIVFRLEVFAEGDDYVFHPVNCYKYPKDIHSTKNEFVSFLPHRLMKDTGYILSLIEQEYQNFSYDATNFSYLGPYYIRISCYGHEVYGYVFVAPNVEGFSLDEPFYDLVQDKNIFILESSPIVWVAFHRGTPYYFDVKLVEGEDIHAEG